MNVAIRVYQIDLGRPWCRPMKTVSTKLDDKSCNYLSDVAERERTTVSDVLRKMIDRYQDNGIQEIYVDKEADLPPVPEDNRNVRIDLSPDTYNLISNLAERKGWSVGGTITHLYNSYPWHVLACEKCQKNISDHGIVISTVDELKDILNKERATYYVKRANNVGLSDLPEEVQSLIRVK